MVAITSDHTRGDRQREAYPLPVLGPEIQNQGAGSHPPTPQTLGEDPSCPLAAGGSRRPWAGSHIHPLFTWLLFIWLLLYLCLLSYKDTCPWIQGHPEDAEESPHLCILVLIPSANSLFPNKATFAVSQDKDVDVSVLGSPLTYDRLSPSRPQIHVCLMCIIRSSHPNTLPSPNPLPALSPECHPAPSSSEVPNPTFHVIGTGCW